MIVDTSAIIAILLQEPEAEAFKTLLLDDSTEAAISTVSVLEGSLVMRRRIGPRGTAVVFDLVAGLGLDVIAFDAAQLVSAIEADNRYGKGLNRPGKLNFGDCASYALAKTQDRPLLFKGDDFAATDIVPALLN